MARELDGQDDGRAAEELAVQEDRLRVLHGLRTEARLVAGFEPPFVAFVRALRERLHPRGVTDIRTVTLADGLTVSVDVGDRLGCDVFYGYYEEAFDARLFTGSLLPGATVVDIGANFGFYALQSARAGGASATVHAFEPDPNALAMLRTNIRANDLEDRVSAWQLVVGETDGTVHLQLAAESAFTSVRPTGRSEMRGSVEVPMRSLDSFAAEHGIASIDALKIDAEGFEGPILRGARGLLKASPDPLVLLEVSAKNLTDSLQEELADALADLLSDGFTAFRPDAGVASGVRAVGTAADIAHLTNTNVFLVRAGGEAEQRLTAVARSVMGDATTALDVNVVDADAREVRVFQGLDPAVLAPVLDDRDALRRRVKDLEAVLRGERQGAITGDAEIDRLRAENQELSALVEQLSATRSELRSATEQGEAVVERQSAEVQALRDAQDNAKRIIRHQAERIDELMATVADHDAKMRALREQSEAVMERQSEEVGILREAVERAKAKLERHPIQIAERTARIAQLQEDLRRLRAESDAVVERQSAEVLTLREALDHARSTVQGQRDELLELRRRVMSEEQTTLWRDMVDRQAAEVQQLRATVERTRAQLDDWRALSERLATENEDRRERLEEAQRQVFEKRELIDQLWAKLAAARADRDALQARCTDQMNEIWRLRGDHGTEPVDPAAPPARRLG